MKPQHALYHFLHKHSRQGPLLLACSGGVDSMALFSLLQEAQVPFSVAHVDHQLRHDAKLVAEKLKQLCEEKKIRYFSKQLSLPKKNMENAARQERLSFFASLQKTFGFQATLLAHHKDDLAETTLKRLFEGAPLPKLWALKAVTTWEGHTLWRPLLSVSKKCLINYVQQKELCFFEDTTNFDGSNLRSLLRTELLPTLEAHFGKNIVSPLVGVSKEAMYLEVFLEEALAPYCLTDKTLTSPPQSAFLRYHLLKKWLQVRGLTVHRRVIEDVVEKMEKQSVFQHRIDSSILLIQPTLWQLVQ